MQQGEFTKGLIASNPVFVLLLGICPTLATSSAMNTALVMGLAVTFVLACSNVVVSLIRTVVPKGVRIAAYIVVIASFVTIADLVLKARLPAVSEKIGIFIPLIVVNCIILGRAEAFASRNRVGSSLLDGLGMGLGFTGALLFISVFRELLGTGRLWGHQILTSYNPMSVLIMAPGAFLILGLMLAFFRWVGELRRAH